MVLLVLIIVFVSDFVLHISNFDSRVKNHLRVLIKIASAWFPLAYDLKMNSADN
jgi:hypothetical protein